MQTGERVDDQREPVGQVVAGAAVEANAVAVLAGDDAEAVVFDLVQPRLAGRRLRGLPWSGLGLSRPKVMNGCEPVSGWILLTGEAINGQVSFPATFKPFTGSDG